jgi:hypothetical protein
MRCTGFATEARQMTTPEPAPKRQHGQAVGLGLAVGAATGNIATWIPFGVAVGLAIGVGLARRGAR